MAPGGNEQAIAELQARVLEGAPLLEQGHGIEHDASTDHRAYLRMEHSRRDQVEDMAAIANMDGVSGVVPSLIARHGVENAGRAESTILPFPSSPHWAPTTARFFFIEDHECLESGGQAPSVGIKGEAARLLKLLEVLRHQREDSALIEVLPVYATTILVVLFLEKRAAKQNLATGAAPGALTLTFAEQPLIRLRVQICSEEPADLPVSLERPQTDQNRDHTPIPKRLRNQQP